MRLRSAVFASIAALALPAGATAQSTDDEWAAGAGGHLVFLTQARSQGASDGNSVAQVFGPDGQRSAQEPISTGYAGPIAAVGPRGDVLFTWYDRERQLWVRYRTAAGALGGPEPVAGPVDWSEASIAIGLDGAGTATVVYSPETPDERGDVTVRTRTEAGVWSAPQTLGGDDVFAPTLAVTPNGSAVLAWRQSADPKPLNANELVVTTRAAGAATFGPVARLVSHRFEPSDPSVAANDRGDAVVGWSELRGRHHEFSVHARFRSPGTGFGPKRRLNRTREMAGPWVTVLPSGRMVLGWTDNLRRRAEGVVRRADGTFGPVRKFTEDLEQNSDLFPLAIGRGAIAWADRDPDVSTLRIAHTTATGRILEGETITRVKGWSVGPAFAAGPSGVNVVAARPMRPTDPIRWLRAPSIG